MSVVSNQSMDKKELDDLSAYTAAQRMPQISRLHTNKKKEELKSAEKYAFAACVHLLLICMKPLSLTTRSTSASNCTHVLAIKHD